MWLRALLHCRRRLSTENPPAGTPKPVLEGQGRMILRRGPDGPETVRAATEGNLPPVMLQGNLVEVLGREVERGWPGELMVQSSPSRQRRPPCKTNKEMSDEAVVAAALTYLFTYFNLRTPGAR